MAYVVKEAAACYSCGTYTTRRLRKYRMPCCIDCAVKRASESVSDQRAHSGPWYENWRESMQKYAAREGWGTPPSSTGVRPADTSCE